MKNFLDFLNNASEEELNQLKEITPEQVQALIAARPLKDLSGVEGVTAEQLEQWRSSFETEIEETVQPQKPSVKGRVWKVLRWVLLLLIVAGVLFAGYYYGIPLFKEKILNPLQNNTNRVSEIATQQAQDVQALSSEIASLKEQVATLQTRADSADAAITANSRSIDSLKNMQSTLQASLAGQHDELLASLDLQLTFTRSIELLSRSRLYLSQGNNGLARDDAAAARDLLYGLLEKVPSDQADSLRTVIERVDSALSNLPAYPAVAVFDLDAAWQYLVDGLPSVPASAVTPVVEETQPSPLPASTLEATPIP
jgi:hypothetical protein